MSLAQRILKGLRAFSGDRRGVSAVEFALIAPFLIGTYLGMAELAQGMMAHRRVSHAVSAVGDLIGQEDAILTDDDKANIFAAASNIVSPFPTAPLKLRVTSMSGDALGQPKVDWSDGSDGLTAYARCNTVPDFPTGLITAKGENVIMAEATYLYTSPIAKILPSNGLTFSEKFYLRPRRQAKVPRQGEITSPAC